MSNSAGIHHITAIAGEPRRHVEFYTRVLGLRFVKRTVNFDDPSTWHLYYGDEVGAPGTALTFFVWKDLPPGRHGANEAQEIAFAIPPGALEFWRKRLKDQGVAHADTPVRFGESVIALADPDGLKLELVAAKTADNIPGWSVGEIAAEHAIRGFHGITLELRDPAPTARVLTEVFGFEAAGEEGDRRRLVALSGPLGTIVDLRVAPSMASASPGTGTVHHVAFRAAGDAEEMEMRARALSLGLRATEQVPRFYFRSVYFREPGGILFEIATDGPGFTIDEPKEQFGSRVMLPPWYEQRRAEIEAALPPLE
jgi:glyoxalase family protein